ncbi:interferon alpha-inducible protein 27-like protein 2B isoform X2 [Gopherus evgoodei]|uniref:interferon alpha-inducible protein 27-like protein 2B isoform X2 n=1 Tax=Gopherus evgoodei TaxID=1825980 RepID=UPI0011CED514|nr:interferon alpha-inducible protein 27-like protein 2B isoform X2 [Gopherus evgoodei]
MSFQATQALGQVWDRDPECHSYRQGLTKRSRYPSDQGVWVRVSVMVGFIPIAVGATVGLGVVTVAVPAALGAAGFTGAGIAAGTLASKMMSAAAVASGGGVAAGSTVAVLQSVGTAAATCLLLVLPSQQRALTIRLAGG